MSSPDLNGRNIFITGGTQGIGLAAVHAALRANGNVLFCARTMPDVKRVEDDLHERFGSGRIKGVVADVSDEQAIVSAIARLNAEFGPLHCVIHAAAVLGPIGTILNIEPADWLRTIEIDLFGTFLVIRAAWRSMRTTGGGRIAVFSGGGAAAPFPRYTAYACSKVAVVRFVESVAQEMATDNIAINAIAPGFVATRMHKATLAAGEAAGQSYLERTVADLAAGGVPPELGAEAACFFVSSAADGITGRFVSAPWDDWRAWPQRRDEIEKSDFFTLRRIVPRDRNADWQ